MQTQLMKKKRPVPAPVVNKRRPAEKAAIKIWKSSFFHSFCKSQKKKVHFRDHKNMKIKDDKHAFLIIFGCKTQVILHVHF